jgi:hypothetical protein
MKFTKENLIENIDELGTWSSYGLASLALRHYFPDEYLDDDDNGDQKTTEQEADLLNKLGCKYWTDAVIKYHTEVGYEDWQLSNENVVNES